LEGMGGVWKEGDIPVLLLLGLEKRRLVERMNRVLRERLLPVQELWTVSQPKPQRGEPRGYDGGKEAKGRKRHLLWTPGAIAEGEGA
jgi:hypothetical protein